MVDNHLQLYNAGQKVWILTAIQPGPTLLACIIISEHKVTHFKLQVYYAWEHLCPIPVKCVSYLYMPSFSHGFHSESGQPNQNIVNERKRQPSK